MSFQDLLDDDFDTILSDDWGPSEVVTYRRLTAPGSGTYEFERSITVHFMKGDRERQGNESGRVETTTATVFVKKHATEGVESVDLKKDHIERSDATKWAPVRLMHDGTGSMHVEMKKHEQVFVSSKDARLER